MPRRLVEGRTSGVSSGSFPDLTAQVVIEGPTDDALFRRPGLNAQLTHAFGQTLAFDTVIENLDVGDPAGDHTFELFLRGAGVPQGEVPLDAVSVSTAILAGQSGIVLSVPGILLPGQTIEVEMQEAVAVNDPNWIGSWEDIYSPLNDVPVSGERLTQVIQEISPGNDFVLGGPSADDEFSLREVRNALPGGGLLAGLIFINLDVIDHVMTYTLNTPTGDVVIASQDVTAGESAFAGTIGGGGIGDPPFLPGAINLTEGYGITVTVATAIDGAGRAPVVLGVYTDRV